MTTFLLVLVLLVALAATVAGLLVLRDVRRLRADSAAAGDSDVTVTAIHQAVTTLRQHNQRQHRETRAVVDALFSLAQLGPSGAPSPSTQGWSASAMVLRQLAEQVTEHRPELVVELGGGGSSVLLGRLLKAQGSGRVVSIEHDHAWAEVTRAHLVRHGVDDIVEIRLAPLTEVTLGADVYQWYDPAALADLRDVDLVFVDGPPGRTGRHARFPAVPVLAPHCRPGARVLLDDGARTQEQGVVQRWVSEHGAVQVASDDIGTGWVQLTLP